MKDEIQKALEELIKADSAWIEAKETLTKSELEERKARYNRRIAWDDYNAKIRDLEFNA
jgi:hypothetical protein